MWNPILELVKKSRELANRKYPGGYTKAQLILCSREVYDGFGTSPATKKILTYQDVDNAGSAMSEIDGGYPRGMSTCMIVGINGNCGQTCPAYLDGTCESEEMTNCSIEWEDPVAQFLHLDIYGDGDDDSGD